MKYAVIDIGSNSVRLMLSDGLKTLSKHVTVTKLAGGIKDGILVDEAIKRTVNAVSFFVDKAKNERVDKTLIFATAAVRLAKNRQVFVDKIKDACGIDVDVISGDLEAYLGGLGALNNNDGGIIDVGGASSEIFVFIDKKITYSKSLNIGAVTITDKCGQNKNKALEFSNDIVKQYGEVPSCKFYAIGGTATTVSAILQELEPYDSSKVHNFVVTKSDLTSLLNKLCTLTIEERKMLKGLQPDRAEVIAGGAAILLNIFNHLKIDEITISENDNLEGYLLKYLG